METHCPKALTARLAAHEKAEAANTHETIGALVVAGGWIAKLKRQVKKLKKRCK